MHLLCPHCRNSIELVEIQPGQEIACPSCGSSFKLEGASTTAYQPLQGQKLGKFELLDRVGVGAFGTVYKARDPELDRTVAIKVPRMTAGINPAARQEFERFLREARSVAQLRHPSIVTVHEVGQADLPSPLGGRGAGGEGDSSPLSPNGGEGSGVRGESVPYLVSDFVEGITLADLLSSPGRRPGFRESAELISQVADALQYAHDHGVVHRDVKPSNIMLESHPQIAQMTQMNSDQSAKSAKSADRLLPRLMDFGLAKRDAGEITMTVDGQVLGTPAYMSPEQAKGEAHQVDGRSDVYSLGVILYQLLTGELPFRGNTRMLIHQVLNEDPRPPRKLNDRIPRDLETMCLKAMAKEAGRRYRSAGALADDLRRFLKGEAILARPVGRVEKAWRWCRRNPAVAALTAAVALLLLGITIASVGVSLYLHALHGDLQAAVDEAERKGKSEARQRQRAEANFLRARDVVDRSLFRLGQVELAQIPQMDKIRRDILQDVLTFYQGFLRDPGDDPEVRLEAGRAHGWVALIHLKLGQFDRAEEYYLAGISVLKQLADDYPDVARYRHDLSADIANLGTLHLHASRFDQAERYLRQAVAIQEALVADHPDQPQWQRNLAANYDTLASIYRATSKQDLAGAYYRKAAALLEQLVREPSSVPDYQRVLASTYSNMGIHYEDLGDWKKAEEAYLRALEIRAKLVNQFHEAADFRNELAGIHKNLGALYGSTGRWIEAEKALLEALRIQEQLCREHPDVLLYEFDLSGTHNNLGLLYQDARRFAEAEASFKAAIEFRERLHRLHQSNHDFAAELGATYGNLGHLMRGSGRSAEAFPWYQRAIAILGKVLQVESRHADARNYLRNAHSGRARTLAGMGRYQEALPDWDRALELDRGPRRDELSLDRALTLAHLGDHKQATAEASRLVAKPTTLPETCYDLACVYALSAAAVKEQAPVAEEYAAQAVKLLSRAQEEGYFKNPARIELLKKNSDLHSLRQRKDFADLLRSLEKR